MSKPKKLDKDRFRKDLGNIIQGYQEWRGEWALCQKRQIVKLILKTIPIKLKIKLKLL